MPKGRRRAPPDYWDEACTRLSQRDPVIARLVRRFDGSCLEGGVDACTTLCRAVVGQQISLQAADGIWEKTTRHFGKITPGKLYFCQHQTLRKCGLSRQKAACLKEIARFFVRRNITRRYWRETNIDTLRAELLEIKGVGAWTFEMFAIFHLRHPDILPLGDLGLVNAIHRQYNRGRPLKRDRLLCITRRWAPWSTVATWYLWRSIDPEPVVY